MLWVPLAASHFRRPFRIHLVASQFLCLTARPR